MDSISSFLLLLLSQIPGIYRNMNMNPGVRWLLLWAHPSNKQNEFLVGTFHNLNIQVARVISQNWISIVLNLVFEWSCYYFKVSGIFTHKTMIWFPEKYACISFTESLELTKNRAIGEIEPLSLWRVLVLQTGLIIVCSKE